MNSFVRWGIGTAALLALATFGHPAAHAASAPVLDPPALPPQPWSGQLAIPRPEAPPAFDSEAEVERCTVCRLAATTTGRLPSAAYRIEGSATESGASLRLVSDDPAVRDALWHATLARGQVLAALRAGADLQLCSSCRVQRDALNDLEITARRVPEGVVLVYASRSPVVVQQIHTIVRAGVDAPLQF
jgi:hypothetical protein